MVGGGIGGLAAALALAQQGFTSRVIEQAAEFREIGAGIQLGPNVFRRFARLGLTDAISRVAVFPPELVMRDAMTGEVVTSVDLSDPFRARFGKPYAVIHRADLHQVLLEACRASPAVELLTSRRLVHAAPEAGRVRGRFEDGSAVEGIALIGADGLWSTIRQQVVGDGKPRVSGHIAYRAVLPMDQVPADLRSPAVTLWAGPRTHLVHYPLRRGELFNLVAVFHSNRYEEGWNSYGDPAELNERFAGQRPEVLRLLEKIESWRMWVLCDREPVRTWSRGPITLLGDAAHPMLQYLAQGACMAIEDAVCLADKLAGLPDDPAAAFRAYEEERYLRTARVQVMARIYGEVYHAAGVVRELRNQFMGGRDPRDYDGVAWLYEG
ncbi:MAG: 3-hydroxybenzoate 6-monooxygenase [Alphaproteobacteria bacterium]|nr:3-hydroxybenzoate 6-monooxygenase [Alphaproteobacteria bacterium]